MGDEANKGAAAVVAEPENKGAEAGSSVQVLEKDAAGLIAEIKARIKEHSISDEKLKAMIQEAVEKQMKAQAEAKEGLIRKGEFSGVDVDPGKAFRMTGKIGGRFSLNKHVIPGLMPRKWQKKFAEDLEDLYDLNDALLIASKVMNKHPRELELWGDYQETCRAFCQKAMVSTTASSGDEFVPTNLSAQVVDKVRLMLKVAALHDRIPMTSNPFTVPIAGSDATAYLAGENTADNTEASKLTATTPGTGSVTFTAKKLAARTVFTEEINEDSIVNILDYVRKSLAQAIANAIETTTINGDNSATHMDQDVTTSTDAKKAWKGYRKLANTASAEVDAGGDALDAANLRNARKAMGKYGVMPSDLAWIVGLKTYFQMLSESDSGGFDDFRTLEKIGPSAVVLTGQIGVFDGIPVILSEFVKEDLSTDGQYDGTTTNRSAANLVNRSRFWYGDRRLVTMKSFENPETDEQIVVVKQRLDFQALEATTNTMVATVYNILAT